MSFSFTNCVIVGNSEFLEEITSRHREEIEDFTSANRREFFSDVECYFENDHQISEKKLKARKAEVTKLMFYYLSTVNKF